MQGGVRRRRKKPTFLPKVKNKNNKKKRNKNMTKKRKEKLGNDITYGGNNHQVMRNSSGPSSFYIWIIPFPLLSLL